jgi:lipid-A-disaccharide synthase-like uncharacterized protein
MPGRTARDHWETSRRYTRRARGRYPLTLEPTRMTFAKLAAWWASTTTTELVWLGIGFVAQLMFSMRFILQWIASERAKRSIVPEVFWYFSVAGGAMLFAYAIYRMDPVFMLGQGMGLLIYVRNIQMIWRQKASGQEGPESSREG